MFSLFDQIFLFNDDSNRKKQKMKIFGRSCQYNEMAINNDH